MSMEETAGKAVLGLGKGSKSLSEMDWNWHSHRGVTAAEVQFSRILDRNSKLDFRLHFKGFSEGGCRGWCSSNLEWQCCVRRGGESLLTCKSITLKCCEVEKWNTENSFSMPEIRPPAAGPGGIFFVWFGWAGFCRKNSMWSCDERSSQSPPTQLNWNKGVRTNFYFAVELPDLSVWPSNLSLDGGCWLFLHVYFIIWRWKESNTKRFWYLKTCLSILVRIIKRSLFFPQP